MGAQIRDLLCICIAGAATSAWAQEPAGPATGTARSFFAHIEAPCAGYSQKTVDGKLVIEPESCAKVLANMAALDSCSSIEKECKPATELMQALFGHTYHETFPDFIFYLEQKQAGKFEKHFPVLTWKGRNTPYLYGVRDIFAIVFSERPACIEAFVTTEFKSEPNPFAALFTVLGKTFDKPPAGTQRDTKAQFHWHPLSGDPRDENGPWFAFARASVDANTTNRITVFHGAPRPKPAPKPGAKPEAEKEDEKGAVDPCVSKEPAPSAYTGNFIAANGFFSNSPDSQVTVSLAIGVTYNTKNTAVASGGSDFNYNGYALAKFYPEAWRPRLRVGAKELGYERFSFGFVVGTNIVNSPFRELVAGAALGHIWGNVGVIVGVNSIEGIKDSDQGRKQRLFTALEYSF